MSNFRKLRPEFSINDLIPFIAIIFSFAVSYVLFGAVTAKWVLGGVVILFSLFLLVGYIRTNNTGYLVTSLFNILWGGYVWSLPIPFTNELPTLTKLLIVLLLFMLPVLWYFILTKRLKWRGREIFELAALKVEDVTSGYTSRPRPVEKADYSEQDLQAFAKFLSKHLIAIPYFKADRVIFAPIKNSQEYPFLLGLAPDLTEFTWVAFDLEGNVSVHISHRDYLAYRDELSFDTLCESLGQLFIEFLEMCQRGEQARVIERINALQMSIFS
jgi:hypothetical protein